MESILWKNINDDNMEQEAASSVDLHINVAPIHISMMDTPNISRRNHIIQLLHGAQQALNNLNQVITIVNMYHNIHIEMI